MVGGDQVVSITLPEADQIEDTDNLNQKMQIREINNARSRVRSVRNSAHEQINSAHRKKESTVREKGCRVYLEVVKSYAMELAPLIKNKTSELWDQKELFDVEIFHTPKRNKDVVDISPNPASATVTGIKGLLETEFPIRASFEVTYSDTAAGDRSMTEIGDYTPSFSEIDMVVMEIDRARQQFGLYLTGPDEIGVESPEPY